MKAINSPSGERHQTNQIIAEGRDFKNGTIEIPIYLYSDLKNEISLYYKIDNLGNLIHYKDSLQVERNIDNEFEIEI